jgi:hypothetical protein
LFYNNLKVPALLESEVKEETCFGSDDAGGSECSDTVSEEQEDQAGCRNHIADPDIDKKVSQDLTPECGGSQTSMVPLLVVSITKHKLYFWSKLET